MRVTFVAGRLAAGVMALAIVLTSCLAVMAGPAQPQGTPAPDRVRGGGYELSGPYVHKNLTIYLIHGKDKLEGKVPLTLEEAIQQKKVVVYETKNVNELLIENVSADVIFIAAGTIVKGGQQDRVIQHDLIVLPKSGKIALPAFCVEAGRWQRRGAENADKFESAGEFVPSRELKMAQRGAGSQPAVWKSVDKVQAGLEKSLDSKVRASESASSLQLTLENKKVMEAVDEHLKKLSEIIEDKKDVIGFAFAVNGKVSSSDVYASSALFKKLWPKLLKSAAVEAVAETPADSKFKTATAEDFTTFLDDAGKGKAKEQDINKDNRLTTRDSTLSIQFSAGYSREKPGQPGQPAAKPIELRDNRLAK